MKQNFKLKLFFLLLIFIAKYSSPFAQNIAINSTGASPNASAMHGVQSTTKGMLIPRMMATPNNTHHDTGSITIAFTGSGQAKVTIDNFNETDFEFSFISYNQ